ncbi:MAG: hydrolase [Gammaproteobacteria bacterium]
MIVESEFRPPWWLRNAHLQTILPNVLRPLPNLRLRRERLELPDGDFVDIDWTGPEQGPIVVLLHGLEGSVRSRYAAGLMHQLASAGLRGALLYFRGCSGEPNRLDRWYHSGATADLDYFINRLAEREPTTPLAAVGYSLGGNALLKWLGEQGDNAPVATGVAVSVPFDLGRASSSINSGFSHLYEWQLVRHMKRSVYRKFAGRQPDTPINLDLTGVNSFREFDNHVTAPLHGFSDADDYYRRCSSRHFLRRIQRPTLIIHSIDDPFMSPETVPAPDELSTMVRLELSQHGGHVGFLAGRPPFKAEFWLETRIMKHLRSALALSPDTPDTMTEHLGGEQPDSG